MPMRSGATPQPRRGERRDALIKISVTPAEKAYADRLANAAGMSTSAWAYAQLAPLLVKAHLPADPNQPQLFEETT